MGDVTAHQASLRLPSRLVNIDEPRAQVRVGERASRVGAGKSGSLLERTRSALSANPSLQAFWMLRIVFTVAPVLFGLDKFFHGFVDWDRYVAPVVSDLVGGRAHALMLGVGVIEMVAGIGVALRPRIFAYVVSAWLLCIVVNLLMANGYYDITLRDLGLAVGALALGRLSEVHARDRGTQLREAITSSDESVTA
jgi:hypothetical protein